jgi:penicillin-binding protein 1C
MSPLPSLKEFLKTIYPLVSAFDLHKASGNPRHKTRSRRNFFPKLTLISTSFGILLSFITFYVFVIKDLPSPSSLSQQLIPLTTHIRDRNGIELYKIYSNQNRTLIKLQDIPLLTRQAFISIEDKNFYHHRGFSPSGTVRAFLRIIKDKKIEGGSTITQQLVKTSLLSPERTVQRKLRELVLSLAVELMYSKDQILEMYLNRVGFGGASYGIEEASQTYFGKSATSLDLAQSALLAGLPASPTTYSPYGIHPELAKERQKEVLRQMVSAGYITWEQAENASAKELVFRRPETDIKAPHFVMYVKDLLAQKYGNDVVESGGLNVITSLDLSVQEQAQKVVSEEIAKITRLNVTNGAALVTKPGTGEILAMVGSKDYFDIEHDGNVNVTLSERQPGSSIKPVNYSLALERGFAAGSIIDDSPITYRIPGQAPYSPINYDHRYHGRVTLRTALASSFNIPAVKLLSSNGVDNLVKLGQKMGITTWDDSSRFGLSLTLGGGEVKMIDMAKVYGVFANSGNLVDLHPILKVTDHQGHVLEEFSCTDLVFSPFEADKELTSCSPKKALDPQISFIISDILSDNSARAPTFGYNSLLNIPNHIVAVKTGTTNNLRDNWTIGYTTDFLVASWVGNNDNSPMSYVASGVTGASPIWRKITDSLLKTYPSRGFISPAGLLKLAICPATGQLACSSCSGKSEYFLPGTEPKTACSDPAAADQKKLENNGPNTNPRSGGRNVVRDRILEGNWTIRPLP